MEALAIPIAALAISVVTMIWGVRTDSSKAGRDIVSQLQSTVLLQGREIETLKAAHQRCEDARETLMRENLALMREAVQGERDRRRDDK